MNYFSEFKVNLTELKKIIFLLFSSLLATIIGFFTVLYPLPMLATIIIIATIAINKYQNMTLITNIKDAQPHINKFVQDFLEDNPADINNIRPIIKDINELREILKNNNIKLKADTLNKLILERILLEFIKYNLNISFRDDLKEIPTKKIESLLFFLDKLGIVATKEYIINSLKNLMEKKQLEDFKKFFLSEGSNLSNNPTLKELSIKYIELFANKLDYIKFLKRLDLFQKLNLNSKQLDFQIEELINSIQIERSAQSIYQSIKFKDSSSKKVTISDIDQMSGREFEDFLVSLFKTRGYNTKHLRGSRDQGADLSIEKYNIKTVIQAKKWKENVNNSAIQEVVAAKEVYNCAKAIVITNSFFTRAAIELAKANQVNLWNREKLKEIINFTPVYLP